MDLNFLNNYRGLAILLVIFVHVLTVFPNKDTLDMQFLDAFLDDITVIFVALSGYFFSVLLPSFKYRDFLKNKFLTVVLPYFILSIPAVLFYFLGLKTSHAWLDLEWMNSELNPLEYYLLLMFTGAHLGPLWFVPMIIVFYLLSPLFQYFEHRNMIIGVFLLSLIPALYFGRPPHNESTLQAFVFFLPAYSFGMVLSHYPSLYKSIARKSLWLLIGFTGLAMLAYDSFLMQSSFDLVTKLVLTLILMAVCYEYLNHKNVLLDLFARLSFFLFFVHGYFISIFRMSFNHLHVEVTGLIPALLIFCVVVVGCLVCFLILKFILGQKSRHIIAA